MDVTHRTGVFGMHFMLDGYGAPRAVLEDITGLQRLLLEIPRSLGMHTICEPVVVHVGSKSSKDPGGLSGFVLIAESHMSFHTFPNRGFVTIDVYTCQESLDTKKLTNLLTETFSVSDFDVHVQARGTRYPVSDVY